MNKKVIVLLMSILLMLLAACGNDENENENVEEENTEGEERAPLEFSDEELVDSETSVVSVNGEEVSGAKYNQIYRQIKTMMYQYGQDVSDTNIIREQVMAVLVDQEIINQEAADKGINVTEEEANEELDTVKEQAGDQFATILEQYNMNEEEFKIQLVDELTTSKYIEQEIQDDITDDEIEEYYNQIKAQNEEIGELEEVKEDITSLLEGEKLQVRVEELKENAEIEELI